VLTFVDTSGLPLSAVLSTTLRWTLSTGLVTAHDLGLVYACFRAGVGDAVDGVQAGVEGTW
jgi:hypothetical protein